MSIENLTPSQLREAADLKEQIAQLETQLAGIVSVGGKTHTPVEATKPAKRKMSAAHIAKIRAAQKLRWAKVHAAKAKPAAAKAPKKGGMSAAGKARIVAAQKARWAKIKAAKASSVVAVAATPAPPVPAAPPVKRGPKTMSAEARAKIAAAQKARWAKVNAAKAKPTVKPVVADKVAVKTAAVKPAKKKISAEGIARIKAAQKARWAKIKAAKK
jgi:histone H1/5